LPEFRREASVRSWLYAIALRVVADRRRKQRLRRWLWLERGSDTAADAEPIDPTTPEDTLAQRRATRRVYAVLDRLSERDRSLILLFELEGLPASEIAGIVKTSENGVWVALHRARARFRRIYVELFVRDGRTE
jgi:RNA polymerase sigma-70 factor (ECF subfamily)